MPLVAVACAGVTMATGISDDMIMMFVIHDALRAIWIT